MKMHVGQMSVGSMGEDRFIPIFNDEPNGYTLWVLDDPQDREGCREYAQEVVKILNTTPALTAENARLREALEELICVFGWLAEEELQPRFVAIQQQAQEAGLDTATFALRRARATLAGGAQVELSMYNQ